VKTQGDETTTAVVTNGKHRKILHVARLGVSESETILRSGRLGVLTLVV
jgi:hypothetical protein